MADSRTPVDHGTGKPDPTIANLDKIERIVVLMMENRSFDHMLGYLAKDPEMKEVDGLTEKHGNYLPDGKFEQVFPLGKRAFDIKALDPGHGYDDVEVQLREGKRGFVENFIASFEKHKRKHEPPDGFEFDPRLILGYQEADNVPVYDWIARNHVICDRWFSSVPGPTWENRLFAISGGTGERVMPDLPDVPGSLDEKLEQMPLYDRRAFPRWLADDAWRWYSHDPATLRLADSRYRPGGDAGASWDENFAYFDRGTLLEPDTFIDDALDGRLPKVSWIDPNFVDFRMWGPPGSNDDHPPSRVMLGQDLALTVLKALMRARPRQWESTMLVITYDEHGGFYDHVDPREEKIPGDEGSSYGLRVPALVVSPWAEHQVCKTTFDHTSLLKTILLRFAREPEEALAAMGSRTQHANHLGGLLTADSPRPPATKEELQALTDKVTHWKQEAYEDQLLERPKLAETVYDVLTDLQGDIVSLARYLRTRKRGEKLTPGRS